MDAVTKKHKREIVSLLENGDLSHNDLVERTDYSFDEVQSIIRSLRRDRKVAITLDRRYTTLAN